VADDRQAICLPWGVLVMTAKIEAKRGPVKWIAEAAQAVAEVYRKGFTLIVAAPVVAAIAVVPEFIQHVAEIQLGMFASREAFAALAMDPTRLAFGAVKVVGLIVAMLAAARYWACEGSLKRTFAMPLRDVGRTVFAIALNALVSLPASFTGGLPAPLHYSVTAICWILSLLLFAYAVGAVIGDREMTLARSLRRAGASCRGSRCSGQPATCRPWRSTWALTGRRSALRSPSCGWSWRSTRWSSGCSPL